MFQFIQIVKFVDSSESTLVAIPILMMMWIRPDFDSSRCGWTCCSWLCVWFGSGCHAVV